MSYKSHLEEVSIGLKKAWDALDIEAMRARSIELEGVMSEPNFWSNQEEARRVSQEASEVKTEVEAWEKVKSDLSDLSEVGALADAEKDETMLKQIEADAEKLLARFRTLEFSMLFSGDYDRSYAVVSIHAGAGGTDAMDWAEILFRMYMRFAESKGWKVTILHDSHGEPAGYKHVTFSVEGRYAYGHLKGEAGVHRLVRVSPFDAEQMRHTSFALVEVIPELDELTEKKLEIDMKDVRIDTFMAGGHGGQSVNTTYSAVRLTHEPTGIVVTCQNERSQLQNRETAMRILKARIFQRMQEERAEKIEELRGGHKSPEWGNQIRSYVLHPYKLVKDHRTLHETTAVEDVLNGDLTEFIENYLRMKA